MTALAPLLLPKEKVSGNEGTANHFEPHHGTSAVHPAKGNLGRLALVKIFFQLDHEHNRARRLGPQTTDYVSTHRADNVFRC